MSLKKCLNKTLPLAVLSMAAANPEMAFAGMPKERDLGTCISIPFDVVHGLPVQLRLTFMTRNKTYSDGSTEQLRYALNEYVNSEGRLVKDPWMMSVDIGEDGGIELFRGTTSGNGFTSTMIEGIDLNNLNNAQQAVLTPGTDHSSLNYFDNNKTLSLECKFKKK
jgi:hypothetical protein